MIIHFSNWPSARRGKVMSAKYPSPECQPFKWRKMIWLSSACFVIMEYLFSISVSITLLKMSRIMLMYVLYIYIVYHIFSYHVGDLGYPSSNCSGLLTFFFHSWSADSAHRTAGLMIHHCYCPWIPDHFYLDVVSTLAGLLEDGWE